MPHQCTECGRTFADGSKQMLSGCPDCGGNKFQFQPSGAKSATRKAAAESESESEPKSDATPAETDAPSESTASSPEPADAPETDPTGGTEPANTNDDSPPDNDDPAADSELDSDPDPTPDATLDQFQEDDAEIETTTGEEDRAQRDARSSPATPDEIDAARSKMGEAQQERLADVDESDVGQERPTGGRGTPQGPPTDGPDEAAAEAFGLDGAVGGPDEQLASNETNQPESEPNQHGSEADADEDLADTRAEPESDLAALREELNDQFESIKITAPGQYELNLMELYDRKEYIISLQEDGRYVVDIPEGYEHRED